MNITLAPTAPVAATEHDIIVAGVKLGVVKTCEKDRAFGHACHAVIDLRLIASGALPKLGADGCPLAQGFGDTPELAIISAISTGRAFAHQYALAIECAARQLGIE